MKSDPVSAPALIDADKMDVLEHAIQISKLSNDAPHKNLACSADVWTSIFFDGTGNNRESELQKPTAQRALSNVAKLFDAHSNDDKLTGVRKFYVPGVGTSFPAIGDSGGGLEGADGAMGVERLQWAEQQLISALAQQAQMGYKVKNIHLAVFGFSRGATLARAFANQIAKKCKSINSENIYSGARLRIYFLGVFDTVASVGLPRDHDTYAENLGIPVIVEKCVHLTAGHELRFAFPLDSIRRDGKYRAGSSEYVFPGVHSDVGGGYYSNEQGRSNVYEAIPLNFMLDQAKTAGVPFPPLAEMRADIAQAFRIPPELARQFKDYMAALGADLPWETKTKLI